MLPFGWVIAVLLSLNSVSLAAPGGASPRTPHAGKNQKAEKYYMDGLRHRDAAWVYEEKMAGTVDEKDRAPYARFIQTTYRRAIEAFEKAIAEDPKFYQAFSSLGYVRRKTGDLEGGLEAYDMALNLSPSYAEAIEYRAEAYFELGRVDEAQSAYLVLTGLSKPYAARLLEFAEKWAQGSGSEKTRVAVLDWVKENRESLGNTKGFIEKW